MSTAPAGPPSFAPPDPTTREAIDQTIANYVKGLREGDVDVLMQAFSDDAVVCGYIGDEGFVKPVTFLYRFVLENESPAKRGDHCVTTVTDVAVAGEVAIVTVAETNYLGDDYATTLHLIHLPDNDAGSSRWWIVSKLFQGVPTPPA